MSDYSMISWERGGARLKAFNTSGRGAVTTLKIEIDVTDPHALRSILGDLQDIQQAQTSPASNARGRR